MATHQEPQDEPKQENDTLVRKKERILMVKKIAKLRQAKRRHFNLSSKVEMPKKLDDLELGLVFPKIEM